MALSLSSLFVFGEAPALKNIFPQNYQHLVQLKENESKSIVAGCSALIKQAASTNRLGKDFSISTVFRQNNGGRHFYRILVTSVDFDKLSFPTIESGTYSENEAYWMQDSSHAILQLLVEDVNSEYRLLDSDVTGMWQKDNSGTKIYFSDFLISASEDTTGVLHLKAEIPVTFGETWDGLTKIVFLPRGTDPYGKQSADFTITENGTKSTVTIKASDFLADKYSPIKYSLLSAFDNNPRTCFKENSSENIISLQFNFKMSGDWIRNHGKIKITQASIINGDSTSRTDYFAADRIGTITAEAWETELSPGTKETSSFALKDYSLENQGIYLPFTGGKNYYIFNTSEIIKASKHDLSMSGFNLKISGYGWIF